MFILMGDLMVQSGIGMKVIDVLNKWLGKVPGRLGMLAVLAGTLLATLTGPAWPAWPPWDRFWSRK